MLAETPSAAPAAAAPGTGASAAPPTSPSPSNAFASSTAPLPWPLATGPTLLLVLRKGSATSGSAPSVSLSRGRWSPPRAETGTQPCSPSAVLPTRLAASAATTPSPSPVGRMRKTSRMPPRSSMGRCARGHHPPRLPPRRDAPTLPTPTSSSPPASSMMWGTSASLTWTRP